MTDFLSLSDDMADEDICLAVGQDLTAHYPGHPWCVGTQSGERTRMVHIRLAYPTPDGRAYGIMARVDTLTGANGRAKAMRWGGELLERYGLPRGPAQADSFERAAENGLDLGNQVERQ